MKGFINLIKPEGMSSAYAVGAVKKKFNIPCGHMGTLDPMASGVLPVGLGKASRLFQYLLDKEKVYAINFLKRRRHTRKIIVYARSCRAFNARRAVKGIIGRT